MLNKLTIYQSTKTINPSVWEKVTFFVRDVIFAGVNRDALQW